MERGQESPDLDLILTAPALTERERTLERSDRGGRLPRLGQRPAQRRVRGRQARLDEDREGCRLDHLGDPPTPGETEDQLARQSGVNRLQAQGGGDLAQAVLVTTAVPGGVAQELHHQPGGLGASGIERHGALEMLLGGPQIAPVYLRQRQPDPHIVTVAPVFSSLCWLCWLCSLRSD
jgi:hypothetical protein